MPRLWWMTTQAGLESTFSWNSSKAWVRNYIQLSVYPSLHLSFCLSVCLSVCLSIWQPIYLSLSIQLSVYPSVCLFRHWLISYHWHLLYASFHVLLFRFSFFIGSNTMYIPTFSCLPSSLCDISWYIGKSVIQGGWVGQKAGRLVESESRLLDCWILTAGSLFSNIILVCWVIIFLVHYHSSH